MTPAMNWLCGHSPTELDAPCGSEAAWHGFLLTPDGAGIASMVAACDEHREAMRLSVTYVHPIMHPCGIPGSRFRWPENECYTDWDPVQLLAGERAICSTRRQ